MEGREETFLRGWDSKGPAGGRVRELFSLAGGDGNAGH